MKQTPTGRPLSSEKIIRASGVIAQDDEIVIIGSQSILGQFPDAPMRLLASMEADVYPKHNIVTVNSRRHIWILEFRRSIINDTVIKWLRSKMFWQKCGVTRKGFASMNSPKSVITISVSHVIPVQVTVCTKQLGPEIRESIFRTRGARRRPIKYDRFF